MSPKRLFLFAAAAALAAIATTARAQDAQPPAAAAGPAAAAAPAAPEESSICTDRPTKVFATCTVDPGKLQLETDLFNGAFLRLGGVTTDTYLVTNPTLKYGVSKTLDIEANIAPRRTTPGSRVEPQSGGVRRNATAASPCRW